MTTTDYSIEKKKTPDEYLKAPYARILIPETDGTYTAEILEFPGCFAQGETPAETYANLEEAARSWLASALEQKQEIPEATTSQGFSGRLALRLPRSLHRQASRLAKRDGTSLNQFVSTAVAYCVGAGDLVDRLAQRVVGGSANITLESHVSVSLTESVTVFNVGSIVLPFHIPSQNQYSFALAGTTFREVPTQRG
jgi:predicted RNase H-like HicB family nuclease